MVQFIYVTTDDQLKNDKQTMAYTQSLLALKQPKKKKYLTNRLKEGPKVHKYCFRIKVIKKMCFKFKITIAPPELNKHFSTRWLGSFIGHVEANKAEV